jgi:hypothetical protein
MRSAPDLSVPPMATVLELILNVSTGSAAAGRASAAKPAGALAGGVDACEAASGAIDIATAPATGTTSATQRFLVRILCLVNMQ